MQSWIEKIKNWDRETAFFVFIAIIFSLSIIGTTIYAYARVPFLPKEQLP